MNDNLKLSEVPDLEAGRLWDEWFFSFTKEEMLEMYEAGTVHEKFQIWLSERSTKH